MSYSTQAKSLEVSCDYFELSGRSQNARNLIKMHHLKAKHTDKITSFRNDKAYLFMCLFHLLDYRIIAQLSDKLIRTIDNLSAQLKFH